jgi:hypothetical protein
MNATNARASLGSSSDVVLQKRRTGLDLGRERRRDRRRCCLICLPGASGLVGTTHYHHPRAGAESDHAVGGSSSSSSRPAVRRRWEITASFWVRGRAGAHTHITTDHVVSASSRTSYIGPAQSPHLEVGPYAAAVHASMHVCAGGAGY